MLSPLKEEMCLNCKSSAYYFRGILQCVNCNWRNIMYKNEKK